MKNNRDYIIKQNIGLVHLCANKFKNKGIEYDDLVQAGSIGLIKAVDRFDETKDVKFSTYAVYVILGEIKQLFRDNSYMRISRSLKDLSFRVNKEIENYSKVNGKTPTINYLSKTLNLEPFQIIQAMEVSSPVLSLNSSNNNDDSHDINIDVKVDDNIELISDRIALQGIIDKLDDYDKQIVILRYFKLKTQIETAKILNTSQVQISRKEKKILKNLKIMLT